MILTISFGGFVEILYDKLFSRGRMRVTQIIEILRNLGVGGWWWWLLVARCGPYDSVERRSRTGSKNDGPVTHKDNLNCPLQNE